MNIDDFRYFIEAAKEQNLSRAARALGTTQSTLSHAVRRLEEEFGCELFRKQGKAIVLTSHGRSFAEKAFTVVRSIQDLKTEMRSPEAPRKKSFRVGVAHGHPAVMWARAWPGARAGFDVRIEYQSLRTAQILNLVAENKLDYGLCFNPQPYPHVASEVVGNSESWVMVRRGHPVLNVPAKRRAQALANFPLATPTHLPGTELCSGHPIFKELSTRPAPETYFDNYDVAVEILKNSEAWATLPRPYGDALTTVRSDLSAPLAITLVWNENSEDGALTGRLATALISAARALGYPLEHRER
jgi:DNA-binding transcriptional LysR family regulator